MNKYYFISYWSRYSTFEPVIGNALTKEHPLKWQLGCDSPKEKTIMISWQEITEEEYNEYKEKWRFG